MNLLTLFDLKKLFESRAKRGQGKAERGLELLDKAKRSLQLLDELEGLEL